MVSHDPQSALIDRALTAARETRYLAVGTDLLLTVPEVFQKQFGDRPAAIVADRNTFPAAGEAVRAALGGADHPIAGMFVFEDPNLFAEWSFFKPLREWLASREAIPIAVGSGTINDLVKLAAFRTGRQYFSVATAASMDGYTAFGSSITFQGSKQTFDCPAPQAVVADLDVIRRAPPQLSAAGYADLLAKITAGADWICADVLGVEPIDQVAWDLVQTPLMQSLSDPIGVRNGNLAAIRALTTGLMMGGFAMQRTKTSRPASGAEHQFSHLWDMQHHTHNGKSVSHGFKVAVGTIAIARFYERLFTMPLESLDVDRAVDQWPDDRAIEATVASSLDGELADKARLEMSAKAIDRGALRDRLLRLRTVWPALRNRLRQHLSPSANLVEMLRAAGAPTEPGQIGIDPERMRKSFDQAYLIRRRFTVLDLAKHAGVFEKCLPRDTGVPPVQTAVGKEVS